MRKTNTNTESLSTLDVSITRLSEMTRFSILSEDCGSGPSSPACSPAHKRLRTSLHYLWSDEEDTEEAEPEENDGESQEEEEEEESLEEMGFAHGALVMKTTDTVPEGSTATGSISITLTDPDVLDCPICFDALTVPVFQCENGHIACSSCCAKIANKCPSCALPIGYNRCRAMEKVIECIKIPCRNAKYGCKDSIFFSKRTEHESVCIHTPCSCPLQDCSFTGSSYHLYTHFSDQHETSAKPILFDSMRTVSLKKNQKCRILLEKSEGVIFIVNHHNEHLGSAVDVTCVAPSSSARRFSYEITARKGESSVELQSLAENIPSWSEEMALRVFLLVPNQLLDSHGGLKLEVCVKSP